MFNSRGYCIIFMPMFQRLPIDLEYNVEIIGEEKQSESCNDVIALSDDDAYIEDDNYEINIKVYWRSNRIDRLSMRRVCISVMLISNIWQTIVSYNYFYHLFNIFVKITFCYFIA